MTVNFAQNVNPALAVWRWASTRVPPNIRVLCRTWARRGADAMLLQALRRRPSLTARFRARTSVREFEPSPTRTSGEFRAVLRHRDLGKDAA